MNPFDPVDGAVPPPSMVIPNGETIRFALTVVCPVSSIATSPDMGTSAPKLELFPTIILLCVRVIGTAVIVYFLSVIGVRYV